MLAQYGVSVPQEIPCSSIAEVLPAAEKILGYSRVELLSMHFWQVIHPDFRDAVRAQGLRRQQGENGNIRRDRLQPRNRGLGDEASRVRLVVMKRTS